MTSPALPDEAGALFRGAPEGFVAARDALAAALRDAGRADDAAAVKALRKPTVVAWALNQLVVRDPAGVQALVDAGAEVRAAQQAALSSKRGATERLRSAGTARRGAVTTLAAVAAEALAGTGRGAETHADAIARALQTCSVDPEAGSALAAGTLERPPADSAGFGDVFGLTSIDGGAATTPAPASTARARPKEARPASERATLRAEVARLTRDRDAAARRERKARAAADGFAHELEGMRRRLEVIERKHADAAARAAEAGTELARAERSLGRAADRADGAVPG
jgi:hypothetical protein